jgi:hypothetical protein
MKKNVKIIILVYFFLSVLDMNLDLYLDPDPHSYKRMDPRPNTDPAKTNVDSKHCSQLFLHSWALNNSYITFRSCMDFPVH